MGGKVPDRKILPTELRRGCRGGRNRNRGRGGASGGRAARTPARAGSGRGRAEADAAPRPLSAGVAPPRPAVSPKLPAAAGHAGGRGRSAPTPARDPRAIRSVRTRPRGCACAPGRNRGPQRARDYGRTGQNPRPAEAGARGIPHRGRRRQAVAGLVAESGEAEAGGGRLTRRPARCPAPRARPGAPAGSAGKASRASVPRRRRARRTGSGTA